MRRPFTAIFAMFAGTLLILASAHSQEEMIHVENDVFDSPRRPPAIFKHDEHNEQAQIEECNTCHHVYEDGQGLADESSEDQLCGDCHALQDIGSIPGLMKAFHTSCKSCHREKNKGPIMCGPCHVIRMPNE